MRGGGVEVLFSVVQGEGEGEGEEEERDPDGEGDYDCVDEAGGGYWGGENGVRALASISCAFSSC